MYIQKEYFSVHVHILLLDIFYVYAPLMSQHLYYVQWKTETQIICIILYKNKSYIYGPDQVGKERFIDHI